MASNHRPVTDQDRVAIDPQALQEQAVAALAEALALQQMLHESGVRDHYRGLLESAITCASEVRDSAVDDALARGATWTLMRAHAARAEDARYGAGQLSRGAQRAPTVEDCADGWLRVESIVENAERSAREARQLADQFADPRERRKADKWADLATTAAHRARRLIGDRNHAYTFHAEPGFSFGEGWYLAAAGLLAGVAIQIEPDRPHTRHAEHFLRQAGLGARLVPYRSRPRANKQLTAIVADAFRTDPIAAAHTVRAGFLGEAPPDRAILEWCDRNLCSSPGPSILLWVRHGTHDAHRNTDHGELVELCARARKAELTPILFGDALRAGDPPAGCVDLTLAWRQPLFQGLDMRRAQLQLFETMRREHGLIGQLGVTTAGMDGPALLGLPTRYLTDAPNVRMGRWVGAIPGYREVVRTDGYLETIGATLVAWRQSGQRAT